ncbi:LRR receptor-like serine threonine-protein kinase [Musa troglodytarum]|uniref:LRR receptor-like serine threonine-protein kinase n=1 Tax=Musa troglodytarum TaxID=320322 RepID=A0A9E7FT52_9LILI|nr:LRR receptor-like serine threonine-protein kinase [Musa troglodytarum]
MDRLVLCVILLWVPLASGASLNEEGRALLAFKERVEVDPYGALSNWDEAAGNPCLWFGVECSDDGKVVVLKLNDLCLKGTLTPDIGKLIDVRSIILHNNSFSGVIPGEIGRLQKLELLDLGCNNLSGPLPSELENILSLQVLVLRNNRFAYGQSPELYEPNDEELLSSNRQLVKRKVENATIRRLLQSNGNPSPPDANGVNSNKNLAPSPSPSPSPSSTSPSNTNSSSPPAVPSPSATGKIQETHEVPSKKWVIFLTVGVLFIVVALSAAYVLHYLTQKSVTVMPWTTGLSGQLQKAFVTAGVPSLRRLELETACEQFCNIIGSLSNCSLYKGTLSSGVEIAVTSTIVTSAAEWSEEYEAHFKNQISTLSKVNHKNFMNLLGYCEEEEPFTRMMVFEYAPNGTLFEHLHIKEAEQLDWPARMRITMGIAYCLEHMEQLDPPLVLGSLSSSSIYLTEDYAAKISHLEFWNEDKEARAESESSNQESIVYKFGILLLEIISGRLPFSEDDGLLVLWASSYLNSRRPLMDMVDRTLSSVREEDITELADVIVSCIDAAPEKRPTMAQVAGRMRTITAIQPEEASPRLSPLWWAELEIISQ